MAKLTHLDAKGSAAMVDVSAKFVTLRTATAKGSVMMAPETLRMVMNGAAKKGDALAVAKVAGIQAAKRASDLIPLCHPLPLTSIEVELTCDPSRDAVDITATCKVESRTGVEMEALTAVAVAALTVYDMCKAADRAITISDIRLTHKSGGKSGIFEAE
jgi:cyclic pyranopterin phosphate synthase